MHSLECGVTHGARRREKNSDRGGCGRRFGLLTSSECQKVSSNHTQFGVPSSIPQLLDN
jgi:hypothetical protein